MKIIGIVVLMLGLLMGFSLGMDILLGFDLTTAVYNAFSPFRTMEGTELFVLFFFISLLVIEAFLAFFQERKEKTSNPNKQSPS
jgi:hypothetical protein